MKTVTTSLRNSLLCLAWCLLCLVRHAEAGTISGLPGTNTVTPGDLLILDSAAGGGVFSTRAITISNLYFWATNGLPTTNGLVGAGITNGLAGTNYVARTNIFTGDWKDLPPSDSDNNYWSALHRQGYEDSSVFNEAFSNLTAWSTSVMVVSNGAMYWSGTNDAVYGEYVFRSWPLAATDNGRILMRLPVPTNSTASGSGYIMAGLTPDTALGISPHSLMVGMGYGLNSGNTNYQVVCYNPQGVTGLSGSPILGSASLVSGAQWYSTNNPGAGPYWLEIAIDTNQISFIVTDSAHTNEMRFSVSRANYASTLGAINGLYLFNSDTRGNGGVGIGPVGARKHSSTIFPRTNLEGLQDYVICTTDATNGQPIRVQLPRAYDSRTPANVVILMHGTSGLRAQTLYDFGPTAPDRPFFNAIAAAGYIVAASDNHSDACYGDARSIGDTDNLILWLRQHYAINDIFLIGISAGGPVALNYAASHHSKISGVYGISPVCSLWSMWTNTVYTAGNGFIQTAFGVAADGSNWSTKTTGWDPANSVSLDRYAGVPFRATYGTTDQTVPYGANAVRMAAILTGWSAEASATNCGAVGHGDAATYNAADALAFFQRCSTVGPLPAPTADGNRSISGNLTVSGTLYAAGSIMDPAGVTIGGNITSSAGTFIGNGSGLSNVTASAFAGNGVGITNVSADVFSVQFGSSVGISSAATKYLALTQYNAASSVTEANVETIPFSTSGWITNAWAYASTVLGAGTNITATIYTNGVSCGAAFQVNLIGNGSTAVGSSNLTSGIFCPAGTRVAWGIVGNNASSAAPFGILSVTIVR